MNDTKNRLRWSLLCACIAGVATWALEDAALPYYAIGAMLICVVFISMALVEAGEYIRWIQQDRDQHEANIAAITPEIKYRQTEYEVAHELVNLVAEVRKLSDEQRIDLLWLVPGMLDYMDNAADTTGRGYTDADVRLVLSATVEKLSYTYLPSLHSAPEGTRRRKRIEAVTNALLSTQPPCAVRTTSNGQAFLRVSKAEAWAALCEEKDTEV